MLTNVQDTLAEAKRALALGDYNTAKALQERAEAIKAGPEALRLFELKADAIAGAPAFLKALKAEKAQNVKIDRAIRQAAEEINLDAIDPAAHKLANELHGGDYGRRCYEKRQAYTKFLRGAELRHMQDIAGAVVLSPRQLLEAVDLGLSAAEVKATMVEAQESLGGFLVAETVSDRVLSRAATLSVVRPRAFTDQTATDSASIAIVTGGNSVYPSGVRGRLLSETQNIDPLTENLTLGKITTPVNLLKIVVKVSRSLQEDSGPKLVSVFEDQAAMWKAAKEDALFLTGTGAGEPLGLLAQQVPGTLSNTDITTVVSGAAAALTADGIINTIYSVDPQYRTAPGFAITCNSATLKAIRILKDGGGRYLFDDRDHTILGYPLVESQSMPDIAASAFCLLCGDFFGYAVVDRIGMAISVLNSERAAQTDQAWYQVRVRVAGTPAQGYRFAACKVSN